MTCKTETKTIGERDYSVTQWPAEKSMLMKFRLTEILGPSLAQLAKLKDPSKDIDEFKVFSSALSELFKTNKPQDVVDMIKDTVIGVAVDSTKMTNSKFDELFSGDDLIECYKVFLFVLKVNYSNLFKGQLVDNLLAKLQTRVSTPEEPQEPQNS